MVNLPGSQPDGIAPDEEGTMHVGHRPDRISRVPPGGDPEVLPDDPDGVVLNQPTDLALAGEALDRLVLSSLGGWSLVAAEVGATGLRLRYPALP